VDATAIGPQNRHLATGGRDGRVLLWRFEGSGQVGEPLALEAHGDPVFFVAFDSGGTRLVSAGFDGTLRLWNVAAQDVTEGSMVLYESSGRIDAVRISLDHSRLVATDLEGTARVWDLSANDPREQCVVLQARPESFHVFEVGPGLGCLATGGTDGVLRVWDLCAPGETPITLRGHRTAITSIAFTPDGHRMISGDRQGYLRVWNRRLDEVVDFARRVAGRSLTERERRECLLDDLAPGISRRRGNRRD
jgi:WD40 repeat protein